MEMEQSSTDQEHRQIQEHQAQGSNGSSSATSCNPIRRVAECMTGPAGPREACGRLGPLMPSCLRGTPSGTPPPPPRVHQVWPGKNVFFLDGRVICGPNPRGLILTAMAILLSELIFLCYVVVDPASSSAHPALVSAASLVLLATVTASFAMAATRDPGIIPRNNNPDSLSPPSSVEDGTAGSDRNQSRFLVVNGVEVRLKFCRTCKIHRPPRSYHCAVCDNCVDKFDQHCHWISQCVGLRNYRFYLLLICSALAFYAFILTFSVTRIRAKLDTAVNAEVFSYLVTTLPETFALAVLSFMAVCVLVCLLASHTFLVAKNKTSHERNKGLYRSPPNPYDKGVVGNIKECLFDKLPPPRVDFRAAAAEAELNFGSSVQLPADNDDGGELNFGSSR